MMKSVICLLLAFATFTYATSDGYVSPPLKEYKFHPERMTWFDAYTVCQSEGSDLASINSLAEADITNDVVRQHTMTSKQESGEVYCYRSDNYIVGKNAQDYSCAHYNTDYSVAVDVDVNGDFNIEINAKHPFGVPRVELYTEPSYQTGNVRSCPGESYDREIICYGTPFWVGGFRDTETNEFYWSDDSEFGFTSWFNREPNNWGGNENCVSVGHSVHGSTDNWNDSDCDKERPFLCERDATCQENDV